MKYTSALVPFEFIYNVAKEAGKIEEFSQLQVKNQEALREFISYLMYRKNYLGAVQAIFSSIELYITK